jgi:hypothetical protein
MGEMAFAAALGAGAALISLWVDFRLSAHRPESLQRRFVHACVAFVLLQVGVAVAGRVADAHASVGQRMSATFLLLLPSLVYAFLALLWLVRTLADAARTAR